MDTRLKDKVAIVTGGARGIGAAFCEGLAAAGAKVVVSDILDGNAVAERIGETQRQVVYVRADVTSKDSVNGLVADTVRKFGTVDILVNNAGSTKRGDFLALTDADWQDGYALKFFAHVRLSRAAWPLLKDAKGAVVTIGGTSGRIPIAAASFRRSAFSGWIIVLSGPRTSMKCVAIGAGASATISPAPSTSRRTQNWLMPIAKPPP